MNRTVLTHTARRDFRRLSSAQQEVVAETIDRIAAEPLRTGKALLGRLEGLWSARIGNYRVIYSIHQREKQIVIRAIQHRARAYGGRGH